jgi:hypothetical protein
MSAPSLDAELESFGSMLREQELATSDPLGLGGLLSDAYRADQLIVRQALPNRKLRDDLLRAALAGLTQYRELGELKEAAESRLAFRELGLAIGLRAAQAMRRVNGSHSGLNELARFEALADDIIDFWSDRAHQRASSWTQHRDINEVMLATALEPDGFLVLMPIAKTRQK